MIFFKLGICMLLNKPFYLAEIFMYARPIVKALESSEIEVGNLARCKSISTPL